MNPALETIIKNHRAAVEGLLGTYSDQLGQLAKTCAKAIESNRKLLFCGNGGSACDSMHIAGEFVGRFINDRRALAAIALTSDSGILTCIANDYSYEDIFARQVEAIGTAGDVFIALSTSGKSPNVLKALNAAKNLGLTTALFTGEKARGGPAKADYLFISPSVITAHIQESHMVALHGLVGLIEAELFPAA